MGLLVVLRTHDVFNPPHMRDVTGNIKKSNRHREDITQTISRYYRNYCSDFKIGILAVYYSIATRTLQAIYIDERNRKAHREQSNLVKHHL